MSGLKAQLHEDLNAAMKARDAITTATLRMALTSVTTEEVAGTQARELSDDDILRVVAKEAKKRREASTAYAGAGRPELAAREDAELAVIETYLPAQLTDDEIEALVTEAVEETGATGMPQMGQVMKAVQPRIAGRADGGRVAAAVRKVLAGR